MVFLNSKLRDDAFNYHRSSDFIRDFQRSSLFCLQRQRMKNVYMLLVSVFSVLCSVAQQSSPGSPCTTDKIYRQFDFWVGEWEAFGVNGKKAGDSKISIILDSCIILEEWTSASTNKGLVYKGKSFNTYNATAKQWQQTWVDNVGGNTQFVQGRFEDGKIVFNTEPWPFSKDTMAINKLTFFNLGPAKVRQLGEISKDAGKNWVIQYDLEYRRKM